MLVKQVPDLLLRNLETMRKSQPRLVEKLEARIQELPSLPEGVIREVPSGRWVEGVLDRSFFEPADPGLSSGSDRQARYCFLVEGLGYPPYFFHVLRNLPKDALSVVALETNLDLLLCTLALTSVYHALPKGCRIAFVVSEDRDLIDEALWHCVVPLGIFPFLESKTILHKGLWECDTKERTDLLRKLWREIRYKAEQLGNSPEDTLIGVRHGALNGARILLGPSMNKLTESWEGRPAVCIASGPSLKNNVDLLKGQEDRFLLVACDTSLIPLLRRGIVPHAVVTIERNLMYEVWVPQVLEEFPEECRRILLVAQSVSEPQIAGRWPGPVLVVGKMDSPADVWVVHQVLGMNLLASGMCVAHMAMNFALGMGATAVALIGQDLAFADDGETTHVEDASSNTPGGIAVERAYKKLEVPGSQGGMVQTHQMWFYYLQIFERFLAMISPGTVFQCSEAGAAIAGTEALPLSRFLEEKAPALDVPPLPRASEVLETGDSAGWTERGRRALEERLRSAASGLEACGAILDRMEEEVDRATQPALSADRRREHAIRTADLMDTLHASHRALSFIGQSYTHQAGASLVKNRFLDTVERVEDWESLHRGIIASHRVNVAFLRQWLAYLEALCAPGFLEELPPYGTTSEEELLREIEMNLRAFWGEAGSDPLSREAVVLGVLLSRVDLARHEGVGADLLWNAARFFLRQGRPFEARALMERAYALLEGTPATPDAVADFLFDWARAEGEHDLIRLPRIDLALHLLDNIPERAPHRTEEVNREKGRFLLAQQSIIQGVHKLALTDGNLQIPDYRNRAQEALIREDLPEAFRWILRMMAPEGDIPSEALPFLQWLVATALNCRGASDPLVDEACEEALKVLFDQQSRLSRAGFQWPLPWMEYLRERGMDVSFGGVAGSEDVSG